MALIDPSTVPHHLPTQWKDDLRKGTRILFWTLLLSPLLFSLTEFCLKIGLALSRSEENAKLIMAWDKWAPIVPLVLGALSLLGIWRVTTPAGDKLTPRQELRRTLVRPATFMLVGILLLQAAGGFSGQQAQGPLFEWLPRLITTGALCLFLAYMGDVALVLDQYPLRVVALTMAFYFAGILACDVLDLVAAGTQFGAIVLPVVAMGKLALALVSMTGLLIVTGKLHRLLKTVSTDRAAASNETKPSEDTK